IIPLDPVRQFTAQSVTGPTTLRVFPGESGGFTLYDDDGQSLGYSNGSDTQTVWIRFHWDAAASRLTLEPDARMKKWPGGVRTFAVEIAGTKAAPGLVDFSGQRVTAAPMPR
ncbi:MAG TPA: DUF5110 domain-containing protein, partial [Candidatus Binatia bacterium]|nr:DUF5110 domain-containing protein [Candidatus Binatia bacterium]